MSIRIRALLLLALPACATAGDPAGTAPTLRYSLPAEAALTYVAADTGGFVMDLPGMGAAPVDIMSRAVLTLSFERQADSLRVTATVSEFNGMFSSPAGAPVTAGAGDRPGPAVLHVAPTGHVNLVQTPEFSGSLAQITSPSSLYRTLFIRLPRGGAMRGATWTDTVRVDEDQAGMRSRTTHIVRSTWARDTTIEGRTLAVITSDISMQLEVAGFSQGVEVQQTLQGTSTATALWDLPGRHLVQRTETGTATGWANLPGLGMNDIPVSSRSRSIVRLMGR